MSKLLLTLVPLAIGTAVSPTVFTVMILMLSSPKRPLARACAFGVGSAVVVLVIAVGGLLLLSRVGAEHRKPSDVSAWIEMAMGLVLLALAAKQLLVKPKEKPHEEKPEAGLGRCVVLGAVMMATNFSSFAIFIPALREIGASHAGTTARLLGMGMMVTGFLLPVWAPLLAVVVAPTASRRGLDALHAWLERHGRAVGAAVCVALGAYLMGKGILHFASG